MRAVLAREHNRLSRRSRAMTVAARSVGVAHRDEERRLFLDFQHSLALHFFESKEVAEHMPKRQRSALEPERFRRGTDADDVRVCPRSFGVRAHGGKWWSGAVALSSEPWSWTEYAGEPRYCSIALWHMRAWAVAVGGFSRMHLGAQEELLSLGRSADCRYVHVRSAGLSGDARWEHALELWPAGLPEASLWLSICSMLQGPAIFDLRACTFQERERSGLHRARARGCWALVSVPTGVETQAQVSQVGAERYGRALLQTWAVRTSAQYI